MGRYWNYKGEIQFTDKKAFEKFYSLMTSGEGDNRWYSPETDWWISDDGEERRHEGDEDVVYCDKEKMKIILPDTNIDNFSRLMDQLPVGKWKGTVRGVTDDQGLDGVEHFPNGTQTYTDLEEWAKEHNKPLEWDEDLEDWITDDRVDVMESFLDDPNPPRNSVRFIMEDDKPKKKKKVAKKAKTKSKKKVTKKKTR